MPISSDQDELHQLYWENSYGIKLCCRLADYLIYINPFSSALDPFLNTQYSSTNIYIFSRAFFYIIEYTNLFKIFINH